MDGISISSFVAMLDISIWRNHTFAEEHWSEDNMVTFQLPVIVDELLGEVEMREMMQIRPTASDSPKIQRRICAALKSCRFKFGTPF